MINESEHSELDQLLKERLGDYKEAPSVEHWEIFEKNFTPKLISYRRFNRYRIAFYAGIAVVAILAIMLLITNLEPDVSKNPTELVQSNQKSSNELVPKNINEKPENPDSSAREIEHGKKTVNENNSIKSSTLKVKTVEKNLIETELADASISRVDDKFVVSIELLKPLDYSIPQTKPSVDTLINSENTERKSEPEIVKPPEPKTPDKSSSRNYSRKHSPKYMLYSQQSNNRNKKKHRQQQATNGFFSKLEYKLNVTPQFAGQTLNNKGGVVIADYDPQFYHQIENGKFTLAGGLEMVYPINNSWSIYSGLKVNTYKRETTNDYAHLKFNNQQIIAPTSTGDIFINGLVKDQLNNNISFQTKLNLHTIEIPVMVRFYASKNLYLDGGLKYNYIFSDKTQTSIIGSDLPYTYSQISDFRDHNLSVILGAGFTFLTNSGLKFDAGPEISWNITNLSTGSDLVNKPFLIGLRTTISLQRFQKN